MPNTSHAVFDPIIQSRTGGLLRGWWQPGILLAALIFSIPILTIASFLFQPSGDVWQHLVDTVLTDYLLNTAALTIGVGLGTLSIGVTCAWLTSLCQFPGKKVFIWALRMPLAERRARCQTLMENVSKYTASAWSASFLHDLDAYSRQVSVN